MIHFLQKTNQQKIFKNYSFGIGKTKTDRPLQPQPRQPQPRQPPQFKHLELVRARLIPRELEGVWINFIIDSQTLA